MSLTRKITAVIFAGLAAMNAQPQNNFQPGEKAEYLIHYGPLKAGTAVAELKRSEFKGKTYYHARATARTTGLTDKLYKVMDVYEGYFDSISLLPVKSIRDISEGRYKRYDEVIYDHKNHKATSILSGEHDIPGNIMDMTSVFYYVRNINFDTMAIGQVIKINTFFDDELFPFDIRYFGKEQISVRDKIYNCIKLVPYVEPGRIFESEDDMTIWLSDDLNHIPICVRFDLIVGAFKCDILNYSGLKY
jgi:hypothetical protein